jgi:murein DD-endopeptidase MepM/ murein hydrolase activator NlpD
MRFASSQILFPSHAAKLCGRLSLLALLAAATSACSNFNSLRSPAFTGSTNNQKDIIAPQPMAYAGMQTAAIQGADLPPPSGAMTPAYASPAQPYTPPAPYAASGLPKPLGQIGSPSVPLGAPPTTLSAQAARIDGGSAASRGGIVHTVQAGDTAWNISQRYGISVNDLIAANGGSSTVKIGQRITVPGASGEPRVQLASLDPTHVPSPVPAAPMPSVPAVASAPASPPPAAPESPEQQVAMAPLTGAAGAAAPIAPEPPAAASGFRWPVRGRIISGFGKKPDGERNDGINLAVPEGTAVKAAEDGTVIYAGNELKSYGNLVLIRHAGGWVSAYAHNSELQVKRGDQVRRGQVVALSGMSGGVTTPQVHFELRKEATPVDPLQHLSDS